MTDTKRDAFTELGHAALDARHDGTPSERAEAARLTLLGHLPPLPPHVALMIETPWTEVAQVSISPAGKIAVLGIEPDGRKEIVEWQVIDRRWISRVVDGTGAEMRIDHLHYPKESEDVAFTVTRPDGRTKIFWGDWKFEVGDETTGRVVGLHCFTRVLTEPGHDMKCCAVVHNNGRYQFINVHPLRDSRVGNIARSYKLLDYLEKDGLLVVCEQSESGQSRLVLMDVRYREIHWQSDWYDQILEGSVMERDGEVSFVGLRGTGICVDAYLVSRGVQTPIAQSIVPHFLHCLPSGRVLVVEWAREAKRTASMATDPITLRDCDSLQRTPAEMMGQIKQIVEIPGGLAVLAKSVTDGRNTAFCLSQRQDGSWSQDVVTSLSDTGDISRLRFWNRRLICERVRADKRTLHVESVNPQVSEGGFVNIICGDLPLYTGLDRLVATAEGILSWHFVNGTFYVIRYTL